MVYDAPLVKAKFAKRLEKMAEVLKNHDPKFVKMHTQTVCKSQEHLDQELKKILATKGEGIMIKDPKCDYETCRSDKLLKVKVFEDTEATVIGHEKGTGRCSFMCGALVMRGDDGTEFKIGTGLSDGMRKKPPKKGTRVTYKFQGLTKDGKPRFPVFMRVHPGV